MDAIERLRAVCAALPEVQERNSHGSPTWFVRGKKSFVSVDDHHHGVEHVGFWCAAPAGAQEEMVADDPERFFRPPYVGHRGWLGVRLAADGLGEPDWDEVAVIVREAYRCVAPVTLVRQLDGDDSAPSGPVR